MTENKKKGTLISSALRRADRAFRAGFYLEAITISDALISNRQRAICGYSADNLKLRSGIGDGVRKLKDSGVPFRDESLLEETKLWASKRNTYIHGLTSLDEHGASGWRTRISSAKQVASEGLTLAKRWLAETNFHRM